VVGLLHVMLVVDDEFSLSWAYHSIHGFSLFLFELGFFFLFFSSYFFFLYPYSSPIQFSSSN
jgi:hypothetical protein